MYRSRLRETGMSYNLACITRIIIDAHFYGNYVAAAHKPDEKFSPSSMVVDKLKFIDYN